MSEPFLAQIIMFGGNFAPRGWAFCDGQLLPISQYQALFSILGTTYGGDGRTTFGLPELRGRYAMHEGTGPGLTPRPLGQRSGQETVTLNALQIPSHTHVVGPTSAAVPLVGNVNAVDDDGTEDDASGHAIANSENTFAAATPNEAMAAGSVSADIPSGTNFGQTTLATGGSQSHNNMPPYMVVNYIIALQGLFPSRN